MLCQDVVQLLNRLRDVTLTGVSRGRGLLQFRVTIAAESEHAESDTVHVSTEPEGQSLVFRPRRVAVADPSSGDDQLTKDDEDEDSCPWEIRSDPQGHRSASGPSDGAPLLETSLGNVTRFDESELTELIRRSVSIDGKRPHRLLHSFIHFIC